MNKLEIRNILNTLNEGDALTINFASSKADQTGTYKVLKTKRGRGKGGSFLVELQGSDGTLFTTGTPHSNEIVNLVTPDGVQHGLQSESELRQVYMVDISRASALKEQFKTLQTATGDVVIDVESSQAELTGKFRVMTTRQLRGRYGQIVLQLESVETGDKQELWSYRHSGVITRISVL